MLFSAESPSFHDVPPGLLHSFSFLSIPVFPTIRKCGSSHTVHVAPRPCSRDNCQPASPCGFLGDVSHVDPSNLCFFEYCFRLGTPQVLQTTVLSLTSFLTLFLEQFGAFSESLSKPGLPPLLATSALTQGSLRVLLNVRSFHLFCLCFFLLGPSLHGAIRSAHSCTDSQSY